MAYSFCKLDIGELMSKEAYKGPHVVLSKEEIQLVFDILPHRPEYSDLRIKFNRALDHDWEKAQWPKGREFKD